MLGILSRLGSGQGRKKKEMNTYKKYCPNVFVAKCEEEYESGDVIIVTTKIGRENEHVVWNLLAEKDGYFYYSITRLDGLDHQERMRRKAEMYASWSISSHEKSNEKREASNEGRDFLRLAEPIKIGHHSEKRHRALIERNWARMEKAMELNQKAKEHENKAAYWASRANEINLSMPESLEYYQHELEKAINTHKKMKAGEIKREHSYSLTYAKKKVNEIKKKVELATKLWGNVSLYVSPQKSKTLET